MKLSNVLAAILAALVLALVVLVELSRPLELVHAQSTGQVQGVAGVGSSASRVKPVVVGAVDDSGNVIAAVGDSLGNRVHGVRANGGALTNVNPVLVAMATGNGGSVQQLTSIGTQSDGDAALDQLAVSATYFNGATWDRARGNTSGGFVQGGQANGAAVSANPIRVAGSDGANVRDLLTDANGRQVVVGAAANAAAVAGNPVLVAGSDGTNARTIPIGVVGNVAPTGIVMLGGADGSVNARPVGLTFNGLSGMVYGFMVHGIDASDSTTARAIPIDNADAPSTAYGVYVRPVNQQLGSQANAWSATAVGVNGTSTALDTIGSSGAVIAFGNTSGASTITIQVSADNSNFYDTSATVAASGNFAVGWTTGLCGARYVRLKSSAAVTITATLQAK